MPNKGMTPETFRDKVSVDVNGCWIWPTLRGRTGYGVVGLRGRLESAHRASWKLFRGVIPKGMLVCHRCDVRACCNPEHLFLGTYQDNANDVKSKGRQAKGESFRRSSLTERDVLEIRKLKQSSSHKALATKFNVSVPTIKAIVARRNWKHV